ncbi:MAG: hypothetical protein ACHQJ6_07905 [Candidatus Berkiellales bacterium]
MIPGATQGSNQDYQSITKEDFLKKFPPDHLFRFFVDGTRQHLGWRAFEMNEKGYLQGMYYSFIKEIMNNEPLSVETILSVHADCLQGVRDTSYQTEEKTKHFRSGKEVMEFGLTLGRNLSSAGLKELREFIKKRSDLYSLKVEKDANGNKRYKLVCTAKDPKQEVKAILEDYHDELGQAKTNSEKVQAIVKMITLLERAHPFNDANCRSFCMIILLLELLKAKILPPILDNPNQFDGYTIEQMCQKVQEGSQRTREIIETGAMQTPFKVGVISTPSGYRLPEDVKDLTNLDKTQMTELPDPRSIVPSDADKTDNFVLHALFFEAFDKNKLPENEQISAYRKQYNAQKIDFIQRFCASDITAVQDFFNLAAFGCSSMIKELVKTTLPDEMIEAVAHGLMIAKENHRDSISKDLEQVLLQRLVTLYKNDNPDTAFLLLGIIYKKDKSYCEDLLQKIVAQIGMENLPSEVKFVAQVLAAHKQLKDQIEQQLSHTPMAMGQDPHLLREKTRSEAKMTEATKSKDEVLDAFINAKHKKLREKSDAINQKAKKEKSKDNFYAIFATLSEEKQAEPLKRKKQDSRSD